MTFCDTSLLINNQIVMPDTTGTLMLILRICFIDKRTKQATLRKVAFNQCKDGTHSIYHLFVRKLQVADMRRAVIISVVIERKWHVSFQDIRYQFRQSSKIAQRDCHRYMRDEFLCQQLCNGS